MILSLDCDSIFGFKVSTLHRLPYVSSNNKFYYLFCYWRKILELHFWLLYWQWEERESILLQQTRFLAKWIWVKKTIIVWGIHIICELLLVIRWAYYFVNTKIGHTNSRLRMDNSWWSQLNVCWLQIVLLSMLVILLLGVPRKLQQCSFVYLESI